MKNFSENCLVTTWDYYVKKKFSKTYTFECPMLNKSLGIIYYIIPTNMTIIHLVIVIIIILHI